jgi:hypothetical protein
MMAERGVAHWSELADLPFAAALRPGGGPGTGRVL